MQVRTTRTGEVVGTGSLNHAELARLQAAAKRKPKDSPKKDEDELLDESEDKTESAPPAPSPKASESKAKPTT